MTWTGTYDVCDPGRGLYLAFACGVDVVDPDAMNFVFRNRKGEIRGKCFPALADLLHMKPSEVAMTALSILAGDGIPASPLARRVTRWLEAAGMLEPKPSDWVGAA